MRLWGMGKWLLVAVVAGGWLAPDAAVAGAADVVAAEATPAGAGVWRFEVTVRSRDEGWEAYADRWEVLAPDGRVLGTRELLHPHVNEQPFTRGLGGVRVPEGVEEVTIRAHHSVAGYDGDTLTLDLPDQ